MLLTAVVLQVVTPSEAGALPPGFFTPIMALEFIQTPEEVAAFFDVEQPLQLRNDLLIGNAIDYLFMFFYATFLGLTGLGIVKETGQKVLWVAPALSVLIFFADLFENLSIASIITTYTGGGQLLQGYFGNLFFFTWLKWGGIATCIFIFGGYFWTRGVFGKVIAITALATFVLAWIAFYHRSVANEAMGLAVVLSFLILAIHHGIFTLSGKAPAAAA